MKIAGIDYSINSPGVVKYIIDDNTFKIIDRKYLGITITKSKNPKNPPLKNCLRFYDKESNEYDKINYMNKNIISFVADCDYISIENYAYLGNGMAFSIGESTGFLKMNLYNLNKKLRLYPPTLIKMFATHNGAADKEWMIKDYIKDGNKLNLSEARLLLRTKTDKFKSSHPDEDIVDAYWIVELLYRELALRKGFQLLSDLNECEIRPFNHISKANPVNLLSRDFIKKG